MRRCARRRVKIVRSKSDLMNASHHRVVMTAYAALMALVERNLVPDAVLRAGIRRNLREKCVVRYKNVEDELEREQEFIEIYDDARRSPRRRTRRTNSTTRFRRRFTNCVSVRD